MLWLGRSVPLSFRALRDSVRPPGENWYQRTFCEVESIVYEQHGLRTKILVPVEAATNISSSIHIVREEQTIL